ncbi:MAG: hypothetical protein EG822_14500 [Deltaproteobacteria bacterium]|nr:hypothetical protein [Deltaproteobacteria bacterium]TLN02181.1 MAG: hypothetical protein FDZ73_12980 [bacterium]
MQSDEQNKSCRICGYLVPKETAVGNIGYCLYFDDMQKPGESLKIPEGEEKEIAGSCKHYFRRIPSLNQGDFVQWRTNVELAAGQRKLQRTLDIIAVLAFLVTAANLVVDIYAK